MKELTILGCSSQQPTRYRNHGAYFLRWRDEGFLFDPGEGTQRQFIHANIAPPQVTKIFISHFHGDHCLGAGSMLMRLNLDKVKHPIHCYYPASGKEYFKRLRYGTIYRENIQIIEHPVEDSGIVYEDENFKVEAEYLVHGVDNLGWRVTESDEIRFHKKRIEELGIKGLSVKKLLEKHSVSIGTKVVTLDEVSYIQKGDVFAIVLDTLQCQSALTLAKDATLLLCESTYLEEHKKLARLYKHLTAKDAAGIARESGAKCLVLTHFSARYKELELFEKEAREIFPNAYFAEDFKKFSFQKTHLNSSIEISCKSSKKTSFSLIS